ncbi:hypothetical protein KC19_8G121200 [Ceratodon purpureus]|uniref:Uncharacterized protein n=1 Tax=Ceratodon purpureus TaxID=3225 RepID=A0A8T0H1F8_CERPU|nr:hypothetical protein KC19_8G121200 [Ceratodon purpureus]
MRLLFFFKRISTVQSSKEIQSSAGDSRGCTNLRVRELTRELEDNMMK